MFHNTDCCPWMLLWHCHGIAIFQGEQHPSNARWPAAMLSLDNLNVCILSSNIFKLYLHIYGPTLGDIKAICQLQLGIAYMWDFYTWAKKSKNFANVLVELPEPTCSMLAPLQEPSPNSTSVHQLPLCISSPSTSTFGRPVSALSNESATFGRPTSALSYESATFGQLASQLLTMSICEDILSTPPTVSHPLCAHYADAMSSRYQQDTPSLSKKAELLSLAFKLLNLLYYGQAKIPDVLFIYNHIGRQGQEEALVDFGINWAVAKALVYLLDCQWPIKHLVTADGVSLYSSSSLVIYLTGL
jgi:hypothetical protein